MLPLFYGWDMSKRFLSLEVLKGLGIIYLVGLHTWVWIYLDLSVYQLRYEQMQGIFPLFGYFGLHVLGFQIPMLAGVTFYLANVRKPGRWSVVYQRAVMILLLGYIVNFLCWGSYGVMDWDVLQFLGLCMMLTYPVLRWIPDGWNVLILVAVSVPGLTIASQFPWSQFADRYWYAIVIGSPGGEHFWALCPWLFIFTFGLFVGFVLHNNHAIFNKALVIMGVAFLGGSLVLGKFHPVVTTALWGTDMFKPSAWYVLGIVGMTTLMILLLRALFKRYASVRDRLKDSFIVILGRSILWVYLFNLVVGYHVTFWALQRFTPTFGQSVLIFLTLWIGTLAIGYIIAYGLHQARPVQYE